MSSSLQAPASFVPGIHPAEEWTRWKKKFKIYSEATSLERKPVPQQRAVLLHIIGDPALDIYFTFGMQETDTAPTVQEILEAFDRHYKPFKNTTYRRYVFFSTDQKTGQSFDDYVTEIKTKSTDCDFGSLTDSLICDKIIIGVADLGLKERLLQEPQLTLAKAIDLGRTAERSHGELKDIARDNALVHALKTNSAGNKQKHSSSSSYKQNTGMKNSNYKYNSAKQMYRKLTPPLQTKESCSRCGTYHAPRQCPAFGQECRQCHKLNHYARLCRQQQVHVLLEDEPEGEETQLILDVLTLDSLSTKQDIVEWKQTILLEGNYVDLKLDTGSQANVLPASVINKWKFKPDIKTSTVSILTYTGQAVPVLGQCKLKCQLDHKTAILTFLIVSFSATPVLGLNGCISLGLISRIEELSVKEDAERIVGNYEDVFTGLGELPGLHTIHLKDGAIPKIQAARRVPQALHAVVKKELQRMEELGIITKVTEPTDWVHPMVLVKKKDNSVRICIDPRELNVWVKREHFQLPNPETTLAQIPKAACYTVLDAEAAFWQVKLDDSSSRLLTMATPFGRYRFLRLPYGICSAPEVFQQKMHSLYSDVQSVLTYVDDVLTWGETDNTHSERLTNVLETARENNLKFGKKKLQLAKETVHFVGHEISAGGIKIDEMKIKAIENLKSPTDKKSLQRFLGLITYISKFLPDLSSKTYYLRMLLKEGTAWIWDAQAEECFLHLKHLATQAPVLQHFQPDRPVVISVDASKHALGAVLLQDQHPVYYASAALTDTQQRYSQIEKELLALLYGCQRFHYYVYGRRFTAQTDHKPLLSVLKKPFDNISPRLQRMVLKLQRYDFEAVYVPGKEIVTADLLSRDSLPTTTLDTSEIDEQVHLMSLNVKTSPQRLQSLVEATTADHELQTVISLIQEGWPEKLSDVLIEAKPFWHCKEELHLWNGLVCKGDRLVIPREKRDWVLNCLHASHQGIVACKARARQSVYWPGINKQLEEVVRCCTICQEAMVSNRREPLLSHNVPDRPWQKVGIDFFDLKGSSYINVIDYYSKYPETMKISSTAAASTITFLKSVFARHGIPEVIISDNGPPFTSLEFTNFAKEWGIEVHTSSPTYAQSNGMIERENQTVKHLFKKALANQTDPYLSLLALRSTPHNGLPSPAELLMGRRLRTMVPIKDSQLEPMLNNLGKIKAQLLKNQEIQAKQYNKTSKPLPVLKVGQPVNVQTGPRLWKPATVQRLGPEPRSYTVQTADGGVYRRNRFHLREHHKFLPNKLPTDQDKSQEQPVLVRSNDCTDTTLDVDDSLSLLNPTNTQPVQTTIGQYHTRSGRIVNRPVRFRN